MNSTLQRQTTLYRGEVEDFIRREHLPHSWFENPDHLAFKAFNEQGYESLLDQFLPLSEQASEIRLNQRRIATVELLGEYSLNMFLEHGKIPGYVGWVEIMEARPEDQGHEEPRLDHEEIYMPRGLIPVRNVLRRRGVDYLSQNNQSHSWVSVIMNSKADELKFSDRRLSDMAESDLKSGRAVLL